jgi:hypothetical protein
MAEYVSNKDFFVAIVERKELLKKAEENGLPIPQISNYLGECILKIANNLANKGNFNGYSFKDEMICDGIENCIKYFDKFNPEKSSNPFSYYTQIIYFAYLRRIAKEKQQYQLKHKIIQSVGNIVFELQEQDDDQEFVNSYREFLAEFSNAELPNTVRKVKVPKEVVMTCQTLDAISE